MKMMQFRRLKINRRAKNLILISIITIQSLTWCQPNPMVKFLKPGLIKILFTNVNKKKSLSKKKILRVIWRIRLFLISLIMSRQQMSSPTCTQAVSNGSFADRWRDSIPNSWLMTTTRFSNQQHLISWWTWLHNQTTFWDSGHFSTFTCSPNGTSIMDTYSCSTRSFILGSSTSCSLISNLLTNRMRPVKRCMIWAANCTRYSFAIRASTQSKRHSKSWISYQDIHWLSLKTNERLLRNWAEFCWSISFQICSPTWGKMRRIRWPHRACVLGETLSI